MCSYDRAGFGWSDLKPSPRDANRIADELHKLLVKAGVKGPIVLMGHSIAGLYIRAYAMRYPQDLSGLIFVDASTPLQEEHPAFKAAVAAGPSFAVKLAFIAGIPRIIGLCSHFPLPGLDAHANKMLAEDQCSLSFTALRREFDSMRQSGDETIHSGPFGALPTLIFSEDPSLPHPLQLQLPPKLERDLATEWNQMQEDLKSLSTRSRRIIARGSTHFIQIDRSDLINREVPIFIEQIRGNVAQPADYGSTKTE